MKNRNKMKKLFFLLVLFLGTMQAWSQNADLGISGITVSPTSIAVGQTGQIIVDVRNFGFDDITAGCAFVQVSVPSAICSITGVNAGSNPIWTVFSSSLPAGITLRNTAGVLPADATSYFVILNVVGTVNGGPLTINGNSTLNPFDGNCQALGDLDATNNQQTTTITVGPTNYTWTGATNTNWSLFSNWASFNVPSAIDNAIIPNVTNKPALTADVTINDISLASGAFVDINGKGFTVNGAVTGVGKIKGSPASTLTIGGAAGTLNFDQTSPSTHSLKSLVVQGGSASLAASGDDLDIYSSILLSGGASLNINGQLLTLKSTGTGPLNSAYIGNLTGNTLSNANNITLERYIATPQRAWHLLSARAVTGSQTIRQAWQENAGAYVPGMGTLVTSNLYTPTNGFDMVSNSASVLTHNQGGLSGASWNYNLSNTNTTTVSSNPGYLVFVRGDRSETPATAPSTEPTVLRTHGILTQGPQSAFVSSTGTGRTLVGNPYASPIDMEPVFAGTVNLAQDMFIWDPSLNGVYGVGGFRVVERVAPGVYEATPSLGIGPDNTLRYIHAGQAFFLRTVSTNGSTDVTVNFNETMKTANLAVVNPIVNGAAATQLIANLMLVNPGNIRSLADGCRVRFDATYNANTSDDVLKMGNFGENISSFREGKKLIVEKRPLVTTKDTIFLKTSNLVARDYHLQLFAQEFDPAVKAYLQDIFTDKTSPIDMSGNEAGFDFSVTTDPASANPDRFRIIFALSKPLAISIDIKAAQVNDNIAVDWKVTNQSNIKHYEIEKSTDAVNFNKVATQTAIGGNINDISYSWLDQNAVVGANYYRVRSVSNSGDILVSDMVKVVIVKAGPAITIFPNPVINRTMTLMMNKCDKGDYQLRLFNTLGQVVMTTKFTYSGGTGTQPVTLSKQITNGNYRLEISRPDNTRISKELVVADK